MTGEPQVAGDSMMNAAILDGDWAVVRRHSDVENGDVVAAMIEDTEPGTTVKTFRREPDGQVWLVPHNPCYQPIPGRQAVIPGKVVAVLRRIGHWNRVSPLRGNG
jgi:repressor LexA